MAILLRYLVSWDRELAEIFLATIVTAIALFYLFISSDLGEDEQVSGYKSIRYACLAGLVGTLAVCFRSFGMPLGTGLLFVATLASVVFAACCAQRYLQLSAWNFPLLILFYGVPCTALCGVQLPAMQDRWWIAMIVIVSLCLALRMAIGEYIVMRNASKPSTGFHRSQ